MPIKLHNALTPLSVRSAKPGRHADGGGLYLRVQNGGARSWLFRYMVGGKAHDIGLGPAAGAGAISLTDARTMAREHAAQAAKGEVLEGKRTKARKVAAKVQADTLARRTFKEVAEAFIGRMEGGWRNDKHRQQWRNTLATYAYPAFGDVPVADVALAHVLAAIDPIWTSKPTTASRLRGRIESVLDAAKVQEFRKGENPARWRGHLDHILTNPARAIIERNRLLGRGNHHPALAYAELPAFFERLLKRDGIAKLALEFLILTGLRTGAVLEATWDEFDDVAGAWDIPGNHMKGGKDHSVPLPARALAILEEVRPLNTKGSKDAPLFPAIGGVALSNGAMLALVRRMHEAEQAAGREGWIDRKQGGRRITPHGFRSTFTDWVAEVTGFSAEVREAALAHAEGNRVIASYRRGDLFEKRRTMMEAWSSYASTRPAGDKVTSIRKVKGG